MTCVKFDHNKSRLSNYCNCLHCGEVMLPTTSGVCAQCHEKLNELLSNEVVDFYGIPKSDEKDM